MTIKIVLLPSTNLCLSWKGHDDEDTFPNGRSNRSIVIVARVPRTSRCSGEVRRLERTASSFLPAELNSNIGALIIRIGFGVYYTIIIIRKPPKPCSNY